MADNRGPGVTGSPRYAPGYQPNTAGPPAPPVGDAGGFRMLTIMGLIMLAAVIPLAFFSAFLPWEPGPAYDIDLNFFIRSYAGELTGGILCLLALVTLVSREGATLGLVSLARGGASWLFAIGVFTLVIAFDGPPAQKAAGWTFTVLLGIALTVGAALLQLAAWHGAPHVRPFPILAAGFVLAALAEGQLFFHRFAVPFEMASYLYALALGFGGLLLLTTRDDDPFRVYVWLGWSGVGLAHIWGFGSLFASDDYYSAEHHLTWNFLFISSIIPLVVAGTAVIHAALVKSEDRVT